MLLYILQTIVRTQIIRVSPLHQNLQANYKIYTNTYRGMNASHY